MKRPRRMSKADHEEALRMYGDDNVILKDHLKKAGQDPSGHGNNHDMRTTLYSLGYMMKEPSS